MDDEDRPQASSAIENPTNLILHHLGPPFKQGVLPTVFYFALSATDSLNTAPFNQPALHLAKNNFRIFSVDLPFHTAGIHPKDAMHHWATELQNGHDFLTPFLKDAIALINYIIEQKWASKSSLAAMGLSRGGFIATHIAALHPDINTVVGFAPMTQFGLMKEFHSEALPEVGKTLSLSAIKDKLIKKHIRYYIGNRDERVGTDACFQFTQELVEANYSEGIRSPSVDLIITPSIGHKGHGTSPDTFEAGADFISRTLRRL